MKEDLYTIKRPLSKNHQPMSRKARAAQFAPFSALDGHSDEIIEASRYTTLKKQLDEDQKVQLDYQLQDLQENLETNPLVGVCYFFKDQRKAGGQYLYQENYIKKINLDQKYLLFEDETLIPFDAIYQIEIKKT